ncbi:peptide-methionine (S)-S-oxide reductase MsrA [Halobacillus sp. A1]|uniref:peptide-methionine (S)-S-oxide reductase MsrA n=1 Tax=Halobacillus sp. A1 TaxID=2880262 RepID=UPI0020A64EC4|nr:peptide-methionine (S)-S-oxide reductase MsrA [Halobacillus sp. A1]MCP3030219.1 peptide-methionine (S)-S-oxide reductase MsrA [Halobacillus sp. A1]
MGKRMKWLLVAVVTVVLGIFLIPEAYAYFTKRSYESEAVTDTEIPENYDVATFAGGCFWCMEPPFEKLAGVDEVVSGYTGGEEVNPSYEEVASGETSHLEAVQVYFDPSVISYEDLLKVFWRQINPTDDEGQFIDRGYQYTTGVFYHSEDQRTAAENSKSALEKTERYEGEIVTPIKEAQKFYKAEEYHQDYYKENEWRYDYYRGNSGRDDYLNEIWGEDRKLDLPQK